MRGARGVVVGAISLVVCTTLAAYVSVGKPLPGEQVPNIQIGWHTPSEIQPMFGPQWRTGIKDGLTTWQYGDYKPALFGGAKTRDLAVSFAPNGGVISYSFNSDQPEDSQIKPKPAEPIF